MFWRNTSPPSSGLKSKPSKNPAWSRQQAEFCLAYFLTPNMEAVCSSQTLVNLGKTTQRYIPEVRTLQRKSFIQLWILHIMYLIKLLPYDVHTKDTGMCKGYSIEVTEEDYPNHWWIIFITYSFAVWDLRFTWQWVWILLSSGLLCHAVW
jgi:hypothetical protein